MIVLVVIGSYCCAWITTFLVAPFYSGNPVAVWVLRLQHHLSTTRV